MESNTLKIDELLQQLEDKLAHMEEKAWKYYRQADRLSDAGNRKESIHMRNIGNEIMSNVVEIKQIIF